MFYYLVIYHRFSPCMFCSFEAYYVLFFRLINCTYWQYYEGQSKSSRNSLTSMIWCTMSLYRLDRVILVISLCKFCRGSGMTSGRQGQWFLHRDNALSHTSLVVQQFLPHPTTNFSGSRS
jgi:hypothetical protein